MATVLTKIIEDEIPTRFVWRDARWVAFSSINPMADRRPTMRRVIRTAVPLR